MLLLASCAPALAHNPNAAAQQYPDVSPSALEVGDVVRSAADTAARGTGALNGALSDEESSAAAAATRSAAMFWPVGSFGKQATGRYLKGRHQLDLWIISQRGGEAKLNADALHLECKRGCEARFSSASGRGRRL